MWTARRLLLLGVATVFSAGCSGFRPQGYAPVDERCATVFRIDNDSPEAVNVFLYRGMLIRLGTVPAWRSALLTSSAAGAPGTGIHLVARPVSGGRSVTTDELLLGRGDHVRWKIMQPLEYSSITAVIEHSGVARSAEKCTASTGAAGSPGRAEIPAGQKILQETGVDLALVEDGLVRRNEVYFEPITPLRANRDGDR